MGEPDTENNARDIPLVSGRGFPLDQTQGTSLALECGVHR
jgi:hypothetical protein